jgi:hypothetical protein
MATLQDFFKGISTGYKPWTLPQIPQTPLFTPTKQTLPNAGGTYMSVAPVTPQPTVPKPATIPTPPPQQPVAPPSPQPPVDLYSKYRDPATGRILTPQEYANSLATKYQAQKSQGAIPQYALDSFAQKDKTSEQMYQTAYGLNNARNDIATGTTDPYGVATRSGISYTPSELRAIESAYAGIFDPALGSALAKLETKQKEDTAAVESKQKLEQMAQQHLYTMEEKGLTGTGLGGVYTPGANPSVDSFAEMIWNGKATMANVPKEYKMAVASAMQSYGNQINGKPTTTEIGKQKLTVAKNLLKMFDDRTGTGVVGRSRVFGGGIALPGGERSNFYSLYDQLKAIAELDASKFLKGQGQVSDAERLILSSAATSLKTNQSETLFRKTLVDIINSLEGNVLSSSVGGVAESPDGLVEITD